jgi:hypothetical protein
MVAGKKIQEENLLRILNPTGGMCADKEFKITVRFQKHTSDKYREAVELARKNKYFTEEGEGDFYKIYASFYPQDADALYRIFELVKEQETTKIYLNNKSIPYIRELWLFLMWFYRIA